MSAEGRHIGGVMRGGAPCDICPRTGSQSVCKAAIAQLVVPSGITPRVCLPPVQSLPLHIHTLEATTSWRWERPRTVHSKT